MKLSMWILADWLKPYNPTVKIESGTQTLRSVRILTTESAQYEKQHVYVARSKDYFGKGEGVICVHRRDLLLLKTDDIDLIFNDILAAFDYFNSWADDLRERTEANCNLREIIDGSVHLFKNPIFILDKGYVATVVSKGFGIEKAENVWSHVLPDKSIPIEYVTNIRQILSARRKSTTPFRMDNTVFPFNAVTKNLFAYQRPMGSMVLIEINDRSTQGHLQLFEELGNIIQHWLRRNEEQQELKDDTAIYLDLLEGRNVLDAELDHQLELRGWKSGDQKVVIKVQPVDDSDEIRQALLTNLRRRFTRSIVLEHDRLVILIVNLKLIDQDQLNSELKRYLKNASSFAGFSYVFKDMSSLRQYAKQAEIALQYGDKKSGELYHCKNHVLTYGFNIINEHISTRIYHPGLDKLLAYDRERRTMMYHTLKRYLFNERARAVTAAEFGIHRNSLAYRVQKIEELIEENLDDQDTRLYLIFSILLKETAEQAAAPGSIP